MKIGFIGAGNLGVSLGKYFRQHNLNVAGYYSKNPNSAAKAAEFTKTECFPDLGSIVETCDTLFLTVPDGTIEEVWDQIKQLSIRNKIVCHCSGALSSAVFTNIEDTNSYGYSIHPLYAFSDKYHAYKALSDVHFTIEGHPFYLDEIKALFTFMGNPVQTIKPEDKMVYHAAAVYSSNFIVALAKTSLELLTSIGFTETQSMQALAPLLEGNLSNILSKGPLEALTGPVERGDLNTIMGHIHSLPKEERARYLSLSQKLSEIAKEKNQHRSYTDLDQVLKEWGQKQDENDSRYI